MAAQASGKQRREAEARIAKATADALHLLGWLRMALPLLPGRPRLLTVLPLSQHAPGTLPLAEQIRSVHADLHDAKSGQLSTWRYDAGGTAQEIAGLVVKLFSHRHPLLSRCATDTLAGLCNASSSLPAPALVELLRVITQSDSAWEVNDQSALVSLVDLIESACMRCAPPTLPPVQSNKCFSSAAF